MAKQTINLGFTPYDKQYEVIKVATDVGNGIKFVIVPCGRQVGKTLTGQTVILSWSINWENTVTGVIAPFYRQALRVMQETVKAIQDTPVFKGVNKTEMTIELKNGSIIKFFSAENADAIRGETFDFLYVDESCFVDDGAWNLVIDATHKIKGKKVLLTSTPNGKAGWVYDLWLKATDERSKRHYGLSWRSIDSPFFPEEDKQDLLDRKNRGMLTTEERQEYFAEWIDWGSMTIFKRTKILEAYGRKLPITNKLFITADVSGSGEDDTCVVVWDGWTIIDIVLHKNRSLLESYQIVRNTMAKYHVPPSRTIVDGTGLGQGIVEMLGCKKYSAVSSPNEKTYSNKRAEVFMKLSEKFENGEISILTDEYRELLTKELLAFKLEETTRDGRLRLISKKAIRNAIGGSPNIADAIAMRVEFDLGDRSNARPIIRGKGTSWLQKRL